MAWIDNLIMAVSPKWAAQREAWKQGYEELRSYDAGADSRINAGWRVSNQSAELTDRNQRNIVRARARDLERNSDIANAVLSAFKRNVVGHGFTLQSKTKNESFNKDIEKLWKEWTKAKNCDVTGQQSFNDILRMAIVRKKVDGGILFVKRCTKFGIIPFQLQLFEVDELDPSITTPKNKSNRVVGGIEYNNYNRPVGYYFRQYTPDGWEMNDPIYINADDVIFYYSKKRPSQIREMSDLAHSASRIRDVNEFVSAVSVKQRVMACLSVFIKRAIPTTGIGRGASGANRKSYDGKTLTPGMIKELNEGDDIEVVNPTGQSADATSFVRVQQRMIGAGQGLSYESTFRDMSEVTYSSARQSMLEDEMTFAEEKELLLSVVDEIYEAFVESAVLSGKVEASGFFEAGKAEYLEHSFIKQPKAWIDPQKEANANAIALSNGIKTYKQISAETGVDWREQIDDMAEVIAYAEAKGIDIGGIIYNGKLTTEEQDPEESASQSTGAGGGIYPSDSTDYNETGDSN